MESYIHPEIGKDFAQQFQAFKHMEYGTADFVKALFYMQETLAISESNHEHSDLYYVLVILFTHFHPTSGTELEEDLKKGKALFNAFIVFAQRYGL